MTYWNAEATVKKRIVADFGFHPVTNALSADWYMINGTTPGDVRRNPWEAGAYEPPFVPGATPPMAVYCGDSTAPGYSPLTLGVSPYACRAHCIVHQVGAVPANRQAIGLTLEPSFIPFGYWTSFVGMSDMRRYPDAASEGLYIRPGGGSIVIKYITVTPNIWYRLGIEKIGRHLNLYCNMNGYANQNDVPGPNSMQLYCSTILDPEYENPNGVIYAGFYLTGSSVSALDFEGINNIVLEEIEVSGTSPGSPPTTPSYPFYSFASTPTSSISDTPPYGSQYPEEELATYHRYKSMRSAVDLINNLRLQ